MKYRRLGVGERFADRYLVDAFLGQGAMGSVYRVTDRTSGEPRALKVMSVELADDADFVARFGREAVIGGSIDSPHVVRVIEHGVARSGDDAGLPYLVMELLVGQGLDKVLEDEAEMDRVLAHEVLRGLFDAMIKAHGANIVHRDLKPENMFLLDAPPGGKRVLKVLDFGVAKVFRESTTAGGTKPGLGTPLWTAPEQAFAGQKIRPATDVWALGLMTYRILSGKSYWLAVCRPKASAYELALEITRKPIVAPSVRSSETGARDLGPAFDAWFLRAVNRDAKQRHRDAGEAWEELRPILEGRPSAVPPPLAPTRAATAPSKSARPADRSRWVGPALAVGVALAVVAVVLVLALKLSR